MNSLYDLSYGIFNHNAKDKKPFSAVAAHPTEDISQGTRFENSYNLYVKSGVLEYSGITFDKALEMTPYKFKLLCRYSEKMMNDKNGVTSAILNKQAKDAGLPMK